LGPGWPYLPFSAAGWAWQPGNRPLLGHRRRRCNGRAVSVASLATQWPVADIPKPSRLCSIYGYLSPYRWV
jgi:hypothetical protein